MNPYECRLILDVKNYIKKSMPTALFNMSPCGVLLEGIFQGTKLSCFRGLFCQITNSEAIPAKSATGLNEIDSEKHPLDERGISQLFARFFNNKMTMPIFLIQSDRVVPSAKSVTSTLAFLDDIYRHMLTQEQQNRCRLVFKWLKIFFKKLPSVSGKQRHKALMFIQLIYLLLGLHFKFSVAEEN